MSLFIPPASLFITPISSEVNCSPETNRALNFCNLLRVDETFLSLYFVTIQNKNPFPFIYLFIYLFIHPNDYVYILRYEVS